MSTTADKLRKRLEDQRKKLDGYKKRFMRDGKIDKTEQALLDAVYKQMDELEEKLMDHGEFPPMDVTSDLRPYDDPKFKSAFADSVREWCQDARIALNEVSHYFEKEEKPDSLKYGDILDVVSLALGPKGAAAVGTIKTIATVVEGIYKSTLPAKPKLSDIHESWVEAIDNYSKRSSYDKEFAAYVLDYKKAEGIPASNNQAVYDLFLEACKTAHKKGFPDRKQIQKAFLTKIVANLDDTMDWDDYAGVAECEMMEIAHIFTAKGGQIDDADEKLVNAIRTVWKSEPVIQLPIPLIFTLRNNMGAHQATIKRTSKKPGNTSFKLTDGKKDVFDAFMKKKAYNMVRVNTLKHDS
ncbi:MAG: hypothetical protein AAF138_10710 [Planctomycetota bacterium]